MTYISIIVVLSNGQHVTDWADNVDWTVFASAIRIRLRGHLPATPHHALIAYGARSVCLIGADELRQALAGIPPFP